MCSCKERNQRKEWKREEDREREWEGRMNNDARQEAERQPLDERRGRESEGQERRE